MFLSYASQDAEAAKRICDALRAAGVEVWFDQSELVGGDAWDAKIRKQIKDCALLIPIISANTQSRTEGYFRLEWRLADQRTHLMGRDRTFLLPVCIDDTKDADADVPDSFTEVQWTRLAGGEASAAFAARVKKLLGGSEMEAGRSRSAERGEGTVSPVKNKSRPIWPWIALAAVALVAAYLIFKPRPGPEEGARILPDAQTLATKAPAAVVPQLSEARELVAKARQLFFQLEETKDDLKLAEELLKQAITKDRSDAEVWAAYAQLHQRFRVRGWDLSDERREQAREATQLALRLDPQSFEARFAQAAGLMIGGVRAMAEREAALRALLRERPSDQRVLRALGTLLRNVPDRHEEANRIYEQSAALPGGDPLALYDKAMNLWFDGRASEAERALGAAIAQRSFAGARLMELFFALSLRGDRDRAHALLQGISQPEMEDDRACIFAYLVHRYRDEPDLALAAIRASPRDWLDDFRYRGPRDLLAGDALVQAGRPDAAAVEWRAALKVTETRLATSPNDLTALGSRLTLLALLGDTAEARKLLPTVRQMVRADQSGVLVPVWFSRAYLALGERTEAMRQIAVLLSSRLHAVYLTAADLRFDPIWAPLRGDLEFARLIAEADRVEQADDAAAPIPRSTAAAPLANDKSVAVLAFANLSDDKANEYFSDGISEELLNVLAKVPGLKVTARTSSFHFKGKDTPIPEIAKQLGVAYVIEGSVRKQGDKVRITAQLIKAADGFHVWSDTFTRELKDIFAVQDEIAGLIAQQLQLKLGATKVARVVNPEAYRLVLEGRHFWMQRTEEGFVRAEAAYKKALEYDPQFAQAHAGLADVWSIRAWYKLIGGNRQAEDDLARASTEVRLAIQIDPSLAETYATFGAVLFNQRKFFEADQAFQTSLRLNPNYGFAHHWYAQMLFAEGRPKEGLLEFDRAISADPLAFISLTSYAVFLSNFGLYEEALAMNDRAIALRPDMFVPAVGQRANILLNLGRKEEALALARSVVQHAAVQPRWWMDGTVIQVLRATDQQQEAEAYAAQLLQTLPPDNMLRGYVLAGVGRPAEAIQQLLATGLDSSMLFSFIYDHFWDEVRKDPRLPELLAKLNLVEEYRRGREALAQIRQERERKK